MLKVNMHETKSRLSELVCLAEQGEIVIVARNGEPVVELKPVEKRRRGKAFLAPGYTPTRILSRVRTTSFSWRRVFLTGSQSEGIAGYPYPDFGPCLRSKISEIQRAKSSMTQDIGRWSALRALGELPSGKVWASCHI
jgi:antitoxin (DNA-binding transcriptional repressor) of toxin-antitoxin stability system